MLRLPLFGASWSAAQCVLALSLLVRVGSCIARAVRGAGEEALLDEGLEEEDEEEGGDESAPLRGRARSQR